MSADEMIACLGSCRTRSEIAAMIKALSLHPWLNTPAETKRLEAARAAMENWKSYSHACQARHNAHRLHLSHTIRRLASSPSQQAAAFRKPQDRLLAPRAMVPAAQPRNARQVGQNLISLTGFDVELPLQTPTTNGESGGLSCHSPKSCQETEVVADWA